MLVDGEVKAGCRYWISSGMFAWVCLVELQLPLLSPIPPKQCSFPSVTFPVAPVDTATRIKGR